YHDRMRVSVIIPTFQEGATIAQTVRAARALGPAEVIVVDGGSTDGTQAAATEADLVLSAPRGRAAQMNVGAAQALGQVVLFLHADCRLDAAALRQVVSLLTRQSVIAGCFRMRVAAEGLLYRCIDAAASARVRLTGLAYGDQGLFIRRGDFEQLGG